jgi:hypothetical protein
MKTMSEEKRKKIFVAEHVYRDLVGLAGIRRMTVDELADDLLFMGKNVWLNHVTAAKISNEQKDKTGGTA